MDLKDLSYNEIKNFLPSYGSDKEALPLRVVMKDGGRVILIYFIVDNQSCLAFLGEGQTEPDIYFVEDLLKRCTVSLQ